MLQFFERFVRCGHGQRVQDAKLQLQLELLFPAESGLRLWDFREKGQTDLSTVLCYDSCIDHFRTVKHHLRTSRRVAGCAVSSLTLQELESASLSSSHSLHHNLTFNLMSKRKIDVIVIDDSDDEQDSPATHKRAEEDAAYEKAMAMAMQLSREEHQRSSSRAGQSSSSGAAGELHS